MKTICSKCGKEHDLPKKWHHGTICRVCWNAYHREWSARNRNKAKCAEWGRRNYAKLKAENPEALRAYRRRAAIKRYGITEEWYAKKLEAQNGVCAICGKTEEQSR